MKCGGTFLSDSLQTTETAGLLTKQDVHGRNVYLAKPYTLFHLSSKCCRKGNRSQGSSEARLKKVELTSRGTLFSERSSPPTATCCCSKSSSGSNWTNSSLTDGRGLEAGFGSNFVGRVAAVN